MGAYHNGWRLQRRRRRWRGVRGVLSPLRRLSGHVAGEGPQTEAERGQGNKHATHTDTRLSLEDGWGGRNGIAERRKQESEARRYAPAHAARR
jgi:hypothetical protein